MHMRTSALVFLQKIFIQFALQRAMRLLFLSQPSSGLVSTFFVNSNFSKMDGSLRISGYGVPENGLIVLWPDYHMVVPWVAMAWVGLISDGLAGTLRFVAQLMIPTSRAQVFASRFLREMIFVDNLCHIAILGCDLQFLHSR